MSKESNSSNGIGFTGLLTIVFITLKLCKVITWSWWWILSPMWGHIALVIVLLGIGIIWAHWSDNRKFKTRIKGAGSCDAPQNKPSSDFKTRMEEYMETHRDRK